MNNATFLKMHLDLDFSKTLLIGDAVSVAFRVYLDLMKHSIDGGAEILYIVTLAKVMQVI